MGGRGQKGLIPNLPRRGGGGGGNRGPYADVGFTANRTLKEALGEKGKPIPIQQAYQEANPHYDPAWPLTGNTEYAINCQRAVVAYEARRRGYDVTAQAAQSGDREASVVYTPNEDNSGGIWGRWMGAFRHARPIDVSARSTSKVISNVEDTMKGFGNGARGVVQVFWNGNNGGGHVFNVENVNGRIRFIDAQTARPYNPQSVFSDAMPTSVRLVRTDNLRFSDRAKRFVTKKET